MSEVLEEIFAAGKREKPGDAEFVLSHYIDHPHRLHCFVAVDPNGKILGFQSLKMAHEGNIYGTPIGWGIIGTHIRPSAARSGVGSQLFAATRAKAEAAMLPSIEAYIGEQNKAALGYYEAIGFRTNRHSDGIICKTLKFLRPRVPADGNSGWKPAVSQLQIHRFGWGMCMRSWRVVVATVLLVGQSFSAVAAIGTAPPAFEDNLRRAITVKGQEQDRFKLADRMAHYGVPGLGVAIVDHCRIVDARGFGKAAQDGSPVTTRTLFQAASMSKPLAAVAALRLVEQGKLQLEADVRPLLHHWTLPRDPKTGNDLITLRELLSHTAGTNVEGFEGYVPGAPLPTVMQILRGQAPANNDPVRVETRPGSTFNYSGGGYVIVQALMTAVSRQSFPTLMQRLVLNPAGMRSSTYAQPLDSEHVTRAAQGAGPDGTPMAVKWHVYPELAPAGLWTTPTDYARFMIALAHSVRGDDHRLLSAKSARQLMRRGPGNWGLGVDLGPDKAPRQFGHTGANAGFQSAFIVYPDTCQGAVVMTNSDEGNWLMSEVMDAIGAAYDWPGQEAPRVQAAVPVTDGIIEQFAGTYRLHDYPTERFTISQKVDGNLYWARVGHIGRDLLPQSATRLFSPDNEMTLEVRSLSAGKATSLSLSFGGGVLNVADRVD